MELIGKLASILVGMVRNNKAYCPEKVTPMPLAA